MKFNRTVNKFREARGRRLQKHILQLSERLERNVTILDIGGRPDYWENVGVMGVEEIVLLNLDELEFKEFFSNSIDASLFKTRIGDARNLDQYGAKSIDLVHSNSVIEHVGTWGDMMQMARELVRVGRAGWVQTPAWEFPVEPHFHVPFLHWFGRPIACRMLGTSHFPYYRQADIDGRRRFVEDINLVSWREFEALFPSSDIFVERFMLLRKSYIAHWSENDV